MRREALAKEPTREVLAAYAHCRGVTRRSHSSFAAAFWMFPRAKRRALHAIYAFCRLADDIADDPAIRGNRGLLLERWRDELAAAYDGKAVHPVGIALGDAVARFDLPRKTFEDLLLGVESDLQLSNADDMFAAWKFSNPWFGTIRGRVGYTMNNVMLYATFGLAYGGATIETGGLSESNTHVGWAAGGGMEVGLTPNWSAKAEYLFVDLSNQHYVLFGNTGFESNLLRLGVNYRF